MEAIRPVPPSSFTGKIVPVNRQPPPAMELPVIVPAIHATSLAPQAMLSQPPVGQNSGPNTEPIDEARSTSANTYASVARRHSSPASDCSSTSSSSSSSRSRSSSPVEENGVPRGTRHSEVQASRNSMHRSTHSLRGSSDSSSFGKIIPKKRGTPVQKTDPQMPLGKVFQSLLQTPKPMNDLILGDQRFHNWGELATKGSKEDIHIVFATNQRPFPVYRTGSPGRNAEDTRSTAWNRNWDFIIQLMLDYDARYEQAYAQEFHNMIAYGKECNMTSMDIAIEIGRKMTLDLCLRQKESHASAVEQVPLEKETIWNAIMEQPYIDAAEKRGISLSVSSEDLVDDFDSADAAMMDLAQAYADDDIPIPAGSLCCTPEGRSEILWSFKSLVEFMPSVANHARSLDSAIWKSKFGPTGCLNPNQYTFRYQYCPELAKLVFPGGLPPDCKVPNAEYFCDYACSTNAWKRYPLNWLSSSTDLFGRTINLDTMASHESAFNDFHIHPCTYMAYALFYYGKITMYTLTRVIRDFGKVKSLYNEDFYAAIIKMFRPKSVIQTNAATGACMIAAAASGVTKFRGFNPLDDSCYENVGKFVKTVCPKMDAKFIEGSITEADSAPAAAAAVTADQADLVILDSLPYMWYVPKGNGPNPDPSDLFHDFQDWSNELAATISAAWKFLAPGGYLICPMASYKPDRWPMECALHSHMAAIKSHYIGAITYGAAVSQTPAEGRAMFVWKKEPRRIRPPKNAASAEHLVSV